MSSQGPFTAGSGSNVGSSGVSWSNPSDVTQSTNFATAALTAGELSYGLVATDFGFSIPSTATITGVTATWKRKASNANLISYAGGSIALYYQGAQIGYNTGLSGTFWGTTVATETVSSIDSSATWGASLTPAIVNDSTFGVGMAAELESGANTTADANDYTLTVTYS